MNKAENRRRKALGKIKTALRDYGCDGDESILSSVERLIEEHHAAQIWSELADKRANRVDEEAKLARETRDAAQQLATDTYLAKQAAEAEVRIAVLRAEQAERAYDKLMRLMEQDPAKLIGNMA